MRKLGLLPGIQFGLWVEYSVLVKSWHFATTNCIFFLHNLCGFLMKFPSPRPLFYTKCSKYSGFFRFLLYSNKAKDRGESCFFRRMKHFRGHSLLKTPPITLLELETLFAKVHLVHQLNCGFFELTLYIYNLKFFHKYKVIRFYNLIWACAKR